MAPVYTDEEVGLAPKRPAIFTDAEVGLSGELPSPEAISPQPEPERSWFEKQKVSPSTVGNAFMAGLQAGVGAVLEGAGAVNELGGSATIVGALRQAAKAQQGEAPAVDMPIFTKSALENMQGISEHPAVTAGEAILQDASKRWPIPEKESEALLTKGAEMAGGFVPLIASGPLGPLTIGLQSVGSHISNDFSEGLSKGLDPETAARSTIKKALASGITQAAIWTYAPHPLRKAVDKYFIDKLGAEGAKRFLAGRAANIVEGFVLGVGSVGAENIVSGKPVTEDLVPGGIGMAAPMVFFPRGRTQWEVQREPLREQRRNLLRGFYDEEKPEGGYEIPIEPEPPPAQPQPPEAPVTPPNAGFNRSKKIARAVLRTRGVANDVSEAVINATGPKFAGETDESYRQRILAVHDRAGFKVVGESAPFGNEETIRAGAQQEGWSESQIQSAIAEANKQRKAAEQADYENNQRILRQGIKPAIEAQSPKGPENAPINVGIEPVRSQPEYLGATPRQAVPPNAPEVRQEESQRPSGGNRVVGGGIEQEAKAASQSPGLMPESAKPIDWRQELNDTIEQLRTQIPLREELEGAMEQVRKPLVDDAFKKTKAAWRAVLMEPDPFKKIELQSIARKADDEAVRFFSKEQKSEIFKDMQNGEGSVQAAWENQNQIAVPDDAAVVRLRSLKDPRRYRIIAPSTYPDQKGKWQVSDFDERGATGHFNANTLRDAISTLSGNWVEGIGSPWGSVGDFKVDKVIRKPKPTQERKGPIFDDTYKGERFRYGLQYRPPSLGAVPKDYIIGSDRPDPRFKNFGTLEWPRKLTPEEVESFQLVDLTGEAQAKEVIQNVQEERLQGPQEVATVTPAGPVAPEPITVRTAAEREASAPRSIDERKGSEMTAGEGPSVTAGMPLSAAELAKLLKKAKAIEAKARSQYRLKKDQGNKVVNAELRAKINQAALRVKELRNQLQAQKRIEEGPKQVTVKAERTADVGGERPPDIIDDIRGDVGGKISIASAKEFMEDFDAYLNRFPILKKLFTRDGGKTLDDVKQGLHRQGKYLEIDDETTLLEKIIRDAEGRKGRKGLAQKEADQYSELDRRLLDFQQKAFVERKGSLPIAVNDLVLGAKFELDNIKFRVTDIFLSEDGETVIGVEISDGKRFGIQEVGSDRTIFYDKGTLKQPKVEDVWNVEETSTTTDERSGSRSVSEIETKPAEGAETIAPVRKEIEPQWGTEARRAIPPSELVAAADWIARSPEESGLLRQLAESRIPFYRSIKDIPNAESLRYHGTLAKNVPSIISEGLTTGMSHNYESVIGVGGIGDVTFAFSGPDTRLGVLSAGDQPHGKPVAVIINEFPASLKGPTIDYALRKAQEAKAPAAPAEQPPVESVPSGGAAKAPEPARPSGNVDLFGQPTEAPKPAELKPQPPREPVKGLSKAEQEEFEAISLKVRAAREKGGEQLSSEEARRYDELNAKAGQIDLFAAPAPQEGLAARLAQLKAKREEMWRQRDLAVKNYQKAKIGSKFAGDITQWTKAIDEVQRQIKELEAQVPKEAPKPVEAPKPLPKVEPIAKVGEMVLLPNGQKSEVTATLPNGALEIWDSRWGTRIVQYEGGIKRIDEPAPVRPDAITRSDKYFAEHEAKQGKESPDAVRLRQEIGNAIDDRLRLGDMEEIGRAYVALKRGDATVEQFNNLLHDRERSLGLTLRSIEEPPKPPPPPKVEAPPEGDWVYHVTFTKNLDEIRKTGLVPMKKGTNWVQAASKARYGQGEVYVFESLADAIRWAGKMDWEFNKDIGSGKISILRVRRSGDWLVDEADPISQAGGKGKWLKRMAAVEKADILDSLNFDKETAKLLRETTIEADPNKLFKPEAPPVIPQPAGAPVGTRVMRSGYTWEKRDDGWYSTKPAPERKILPERYGWLEKQLTKPDKDVRVDVPKQAKAEAPKPVFEGNAPEGAKVGKFQKKNGRWYRVDDEGNFGKIPTNKKQHDQLEADFLAPPKVEDTRPPLEILNKAQYVSVKLPEGATVLRGYFAKGRKADLFIADANKGKNIFQGAEPERIEAGAINRKGEFAPIKGDIIVKERKPKEMALPSKPTDPELEKLFNETLARAQRDKPELAMNRVQDAYGGGVLAPVVEHVGDLTHRMSETNTWTWGGYDYVKEKVERGIRYLTSKYGFEREMNENLSSNARHRGIAVEELTRNVDEALANYAEEHRKLPVYNQVQKWARDAAVLLGLKDWNGATLVLYKLKEVLDKGQAEWVKEAHKYEPEKFAKERTVSDPFSVTKGGYVEHPSLGGFELRKQATNVYLLIDEYGNDYSPIYGAMHRTVSRSSDRLAGKHQGRDWGWSIGGVTKQTLNEALEHAVRKVEGIAEGRVFSSGESVKIAQEIIRKRTEGRREASTADVVGEPDRLIAEAKGPEDFIRLLDRADIQLPAHEKALLKEFFRRPTVQKLEGLRLAVVEAVRSGFVGDYDPHSRLSRFVDAQSGVHETLHDLWYFLSPEDRIEFVQLRQKAIAEALKDLPRNYREISALERLAQEPMSSEDFIRENMPRGLYYLSNEREFFVASMQHRFLRDVMTPQAKTLVARMKGIVQEVWNWLKSLVGKGVPADRRDALYKKILKGDYELSAEEGARLEAKEIQGALPRTPEEYKKQKAFGELNVAGRTLGAFSNIAKWKMEQADQLGLSPAARRMIHLPRESEMYAMASSELRGIEDYYQARDAVPADSPHLRWGVIGDALHSLAFEEELTRKITDKYKQQQALVDSETFQKKIAREAELAMRENVATAKEDTFRNVIAQKIAVLEAQLRSDTTDSARIATLREDLRLARGLQDYTMAVAQQMDNIVNRVYPEFTRFERAGYWTRFRENATGPKNGEEFLNLYLRARRAEGNPLENTQELALARLASEILGINYDLTNRLLWAERWRREPDFKQAVQEIGASFVKRLREDPAAAISWMVQREAKLATKAEQAKAAYLAINRDVMRELERLGDYEQAASALNRIRNSDQWKELIKTVYADADALHLPDVVIKAIKDGKYNSMFNEFTGRMVKVDPKGEWHEIDLEWTPENAVKSQEKLDKYLGEIQDWLNDPKNENSPDRQYWQEQHDWIYGTYKTASVFAPRNVKSLLIHTALRMPEFWFKQAKLPAAKIAQTSAENWERSFDTGKQWSQGVEQPIIRLAQTAARKHGIDVSLGLQAYRERIFNSLAWNYRHGIPVKAGQKLFGVTVLTEDINLLRAMGRAINDLITKTKSLGRERVMQKERLIDDYFKNAFLIRSPQEFGAEPGTTVPREFSSRAKMLARRIVRETVDKDGNRITKPMSLDDAMEVLNWESYFEPFVLRWIGERSADYSKETQFEGIFKEIVRLHNQNSPDAPRTVQEIIDFIDRNTDEVTTKDQIKKTVVGGMVEELTSFYNRFLKDDNAKAATIRVLRATSQGPFSKAFERDVGSSFYYDYGMLSGQEVRSLALDAGMYHLERFEIALHDLERVYNKALLEFDETKGNPKARALLKAKNKELFSSGDDFRDFSVLRDQRAELHYFLENLPIWSGRGVAQYEGMQTMYRLVGDSVLSTLAGWKTLARVLSGSVVKQGFVFGAFERFYYTAYLKAALSMAMSAFQIGVKGPILFGARRLGLAPKLQKEFSGWAEEIFRTGKYFDQQYAYGLGTKTPVLDTVFNNLVMPYTHGRGYDPRLSGNAGLRLLQKGAYKALSAFEAPLEIIKTIFPTLGYSIAYDSVARQMYWSIKTLEAQARRAFETHERAGTLGKFNLKDPRSVKNVLAAEEVLPRGIFPKTQTQLDLVGEYFKRGTDADINDFVLEFWKKLSETPKEQRGNVHLLSADAKNPQEAARLEENRAGALAAIGLFDIHHASPMNRMWALRASAAGRLAFPIAGWTLQSTRQWFALFGTAAHDPQMRKNLLTAMTALTILAGMSAMAVGGDTEKRMFEKLEWLINRKVDPVRHFGQGRSAKENAIIAFHDVIAYITVLANLFDQLLGQKGNRVSAVDQIYVYAKLKSLAQYVSGVAHTKDPFYGLSSFVVREAPSLKPMLNRLPSNEGTVNLANVRTAIQRYAPEELLRKDQGGYGLPTPTALSPIKQRLTNAIYKGDSEGVAIEYENLKSKAIEIGRTEPLRLAADIMRSLNPYTLALIGHPTDTQRAELLSKLNEHERQIVLDGESMYLAAAQLVGVQSQMTREQRGTGISGGTVGFAPSFGGQSGYTAGTGPAMAVGAGGGGGAFLPRISGGGAVPRRISLGTGGSRIGYRRLGGISSVRTRTRGLKVRTGRKRYTSGRLKATSGRIRRAGLRTRLAVMPRRRVSLRI